MPRRLLSYLVDSWTPSIGWKKIPCHIIELDDKEAFEIPLIENIQRKTLSALDEILEVAMMATEGNAT
jgi:ParB-like chromosome segregation protein Spo0J